MHYTTLAQRHASFRRKDLTKNTTHPTIFPLAGGSSLEGEASLHFSNFPWSFSEHALRRCAQRGLSREDVLYVLQHGRRCYARKPRSRGKRKALLVVLRRRDIPRRDRKRYSRLEGTHVVLSLDGRTVITVYRNRRRLPRAA